MPRKRSVKKRREERKNEGRWWVPLGEVVHSIQVTPTAFTSTAGLNFILFFQ